MHMCDVCCLDVTEHDLRCWTGEPDKIDHPAYVSAGGTQMHASVEYSPFHYHQPPLCCPGCSCRSYEEAHPETIGVPVSAYAERFDKVMLASMRYSQVLTMEELSERHWETRRYSGIGPKRYRRILEVVYDFRYRQEEQSHVAAVQ